MNTEDIVAYLHNKGEAGASPTELRKISGVKSKEFDKRLDELVATGSIVGPIQKSKNKRLYFHAEFAPGPERSARKLDEYLSGSGNRLMSKSQAQKGSKISEKDFDRALESLRADRKVVILKSGNSQLLLHVNVARELFGFSEPDQHTSDGRRPASVQVDRSRLADVYEQLKREQGGFSAVSIGQLIQRLDVEPTAMHEFLRNEAKEGRANLYPSTTSNLSEHEQAGAMRLPGSHETFVRVTLKS